MRVSSPPMWVPWSGRAAAQPNVNASLLRLCFHPRPKPDRAAAEARLALTGRETAARLRPGLLVPECLVAAQGARARCRAPLVQRLAGTVFLIRVASALLAFGSQVLFARWMGSFEFGIYVYVWTWVLLLGQAIDLGLGTAAQRFIPEYRERGLLALLRGFVSGSRWLALAIAIVHCGACRWLRMADRALARITTRSFRSISPA